MKLTPDQLRQNAAAMIAFADGKPIERTNRQGSWVSAPDPTWALDTFQYRPKPWTLPEPPKGKAWALTGMETEAMFPPGFRPVMTDESAEGGEYSHDGTRWISIVIQDLGDYWTKKNKDGESLIIRTSRPLPAEPVTRPWSKPEDVPGPVCWIRSRHHDGRPDYREYLIIAFANPVSYITASAGCQPVVCSHQFSETRWENMEHSTDRKTWLPCTTQAP